MKTTTATTTCGACTAPLPDGHTLCATDVDHLLAELHAVPALLEDLRVALTRGSVFRGASARVGKSTETPLPFDDRIPARIDELTEVLTRRARSVSTSRNLRALPVVPFSHDPKDPARVPMTMSLASLAARVLADPQVLRTVPEAAALNAEVLAAIRSARRAIDRPAELRYLGQCSADPADTGILCDTDLYAHPRNTTVQCRGCGAEHDVEARRAVLLNAVHDQLVTPAEAERALPELLDERVRSAQLKRWVHDRRLVPEGYRHGGTYSPSKVGYHDPPLLRVGDIVREYARKKGAVAA